MLLPVVKVPLENWTESYEERNQLSMKILYQNLNGQCVQNLSQLFKIYKSTKATENIENMHSMKKKCNNERKLMNSLKEVMENRKVIEEKEK